MSRFWKGVLIGVGALVVVLLVAALTTALGALVPSLYALFRVLGIVAGWFIGYGAARIWWAWE